MLVKARPTFTYNYILVIRTQGSYLGLLVYIGSGCRLLTTPLNLTWFKRLPSSLVDQLYSSRQHPLTVRATAESDLAEF